ncbi:MAG: hypothetical protein IAG10_11665 [Planctomycetaceae bacterium]|nr:hypothetical protein [Planctomycetaceae bacterium]
MPLSQFVQHLLADSPMLLASTVGLVIVYRFRQRTTSATSTAMWCLIVILLNKTVGTFLWSLIPFILADADDSIAMIRIVAFHLGRQLIDGAALVGLVCAVFQERSDESNKLAELKESSGQ